jgi:sporulation protein YlmC with PRC-barrel domain
LKTTLDEDSIPKGEIRWSELKDKYIIDKDDVGVGNAIDIDFDIDGTASLTVGGGIIEETLESLGIKADVDIIVPAETIESMGDKIKLKVSKDELKLTMDKALENRRVKKARNDIATDRDVAKVRLFSSLM